MGLESISDSDNMEEMDVEEEEDVEVADDEGAEGRPARIRDADDRFFDTRSTSIPPVCSSVKGGTKGSEADTEGDPIEPMDRTRRLRSINTVIALPRAHTSFSTGCKCM